MRLKVEAPCTLGDRRLWVLNYVTQSSHPAIRFQRSFPHCQYSPSPLIRKNYHPLISKRNLNMTVPPVPVQRRNYLGATSHIVHTPTSAEIIREKMAENDYLHPE